MAEEVKAWEMRQALWSVWHFVDQKWTHGVERDKMLVRLEEVYKTFVPNPDRVWSEKSKRRRERRALVLLKRAAALEKRWITQRKKKAKSALYGGSSSTPHSDMIAAQAVVPQKPNIWAFAKMLEEYIEQREAEMQKGDGGE